MIFFVSDGRLGNQLFQYAFLNTIAKNDEKIITVGMNLLTKYFIVNNKNFKNINLNKYLTFFIRKVFNSYFIKPFVNLRIISYIYQERENGFPLPSYKEKKGVLPIRLVKSDYFQSEAFFSKIDFRLRDEFVERAKAFLDQIPDFYTKVFVHIRRGDYLFETFLGSKDISLPKEYYLRAMEEIKRWVNNPYFIFLSDDPGYVECCFEDIANKIISYNDIGTDLAIMSLCEYGIVSNSSFSWWGAYLMKNRKKVIFPKYWYGWKQKVEYPIGIHPKWATILEI